MSGEVPSDWSQTTLGSLCVIKARIGWRGLAASEYTDNGPLLIAGKHIQAGEIDWDACDHISEERYDESPEIMLRQGDVIFSKDGSIGNPALIRALPGPATINGTMMMLRPDPNRIDPEFLFQFVRGPAFARMISEKVSGSSIPHIFQRDIIHFPTVLPPLEEQRRIAEVLRSVDEAVAASVAIKQAVGVVFHRRRHELIKEARRASPEVAVAAALRKNRGEKLTKLQTSQYASSGHYPVVDQGARFICGYTNEEHALWPYDLPVIVFGDHTRILKFVDFPFVIGADGTQCLTPAAGIRSRYLYYALQSLELRAEGYARHFKLLKEKTIPIPTPDEQGSIEGELLSLETAMSDAWLAAESLATVKNALSSNLLSGRVRVPA